MQSMVEGPCTRRKTKRAGKADPLKPIIRSGPRPRSPESQFLTVPKLYLMSVTMSRHFYRFGYVIYSTRVRKPKSSSALSHHCHCLGRADGR